MFMHRVASVPVITSMLMHPPVRERLRKLPGLSGLYAHGWAFRHPVDRLYSTDTGGVAPPPELKGAVFYAASQPGVIRAALASIPHLEQCAFVDLGCGKGRPLLVATEFPFRAIHGVEYSPVFAAIARRNLIRFAQRWPQRKPVQVHLCDARTYVYPAGDLVVFFYNPFDAAVMQQVIGRLEALAEGSARRLFVVYYNPVQAHCLDSSALFKRYFAAHLPYAAEEVGYGPDADDAVVIWSAGAESTAPKPGADAPIRVVASGLRAELTE
jgi:SAM-dependent methyltransferase